MVSDTNHTWAGYSYALITSSSKLLCEYLPILKAKVVSCYRIFGYRNVNFTSTAIQSVARLVVGVILSILGSLFGHLYGSAH